MMPRSQLFSLVAALTAVAGLSAGTLPARAAPSMNVAPQVGAGQINDIEAQRQALFKKMLADPGNVDVALQYASLSARAGDLEGAISTLERLSIFAPDVARIKFELGVLYYRLGAYDVARSYFVTVRDAPNASADLKKNVTPYLSRIKTLTATDRLTGQMAIGARYQTNANGGAGSSIINLYGFDFTLNDAAVADPDSNAFVSGTLHYSHDLASQGDRFDADLSAYGALYAHHDELNTALVEARFGPVFNLERFSIAHSTMGLYAILGAMELQRNPYRYTAGAGAVLTSEFNSVTQGTTRLEYRREVYENSTNRPTISELTGNRVRLEQTIKRQLTDRLQVYASLYGQRRAAAKDYKSNWETGGGLGVTWQFDGPIVSQSRLWSLDLSAGLLGRWYDAADPLYSTDRQSDREEYVRGTLNIPVGDTWSVLAMLEYRKVISNYDIDTFDNASATVAVAKDF